MKKLLKGLGLGAVIALSGLLPGTTLQSNEAPVMSEKSGNTQGQGQSGNSQDQTPPAAPVRTQIKRLNVLPGLGRDGVYVSRVGVPPKEWGQHLQGRGLQKWTKKKRRRYA